MRLIDADTLMLTDFEIVMCDGDFKKAFKLLTEKIENAPSAEPTQTNTSNTLNALTPRWIPVSERLPKPVASSQKRAWFITSDQYGGVTLTWYEFEASLLKEGWQTDMTILAWMPLPQPWKGADDER